MKLAADVLHDDDTCFNVDLNDDTVTPSVEPEAKSRRGQLKYFLVNNVVLLIVASIIFYVNTLDSLITLIH